MRKLIWIALLALALAVVTAPATAFAAAPSGLVIQSVATSSYPTVAMRVMVPPALSASGKTPDFAVKENGQDLVGVRGRALPVDRTPLAVVLLLDVSGSMRGAPLDDAKQAASSFVKALDPKDQVAVIAFNTRPSMLTGFTTDRAAALKAIDELQASDETALYDAVVAADTLALTAGTNQRSIVLLSDGGDTQSGASLDTMLRFVHENSVPVFAVGLASPESAPQVLARIADRSNGRSLAARDSGQLVAVYEEVARQLQNQYEVTFTSAKPSTKDLELDLTASSGKNVARVGTVIANPAFSAPQPAARSLASAVSGAPQQVTIGFLGIFAIAGLVTAAVCAGVAALLLMLLRGPSAMDQLPYYDQTTAEREQNPDGFRARVMGAIGEVAEKRGFTEDLHRRLDSAGLPLRPVEYISLHLLFVVAVGFVSQLFTGSWVFSLLLIVAAAFAPLVLLDLLAQRRKDAFARQLPDVLALIAGSLRAGYGLMQAVDQIAREASAPASVEFARVQTEARLGLKVEDALEKMARRMDSVDFEWAVSAINIQREVGGNLAQVLDIVAKTIRDREALRRTVAGLTSEGRLSAVILVVLPFIVGGALFFVLPRYIMLLFTSPFGLTLAVGAIVLMIVGIVWLRRVSKIEV